MAYIRVNPSQLNDTASVIENYVSQLKRKMQSAQQEVDHLATYWQGTDAVQFKSKWGTVTNNQSTFHTLISQMESYAKYLRNAAKEYSKAQSNAISRANSLPR